MDIETDIDLQELESRLYSQVFHSTETWEESSVAEVLNNLNSPNRRVSIYTVSNVPITVNRYWDTNSDFKLKKVSHAGENIVEISRDDENIVGISLDGENIVGISRDCENIVNTTDNTLLHQNSNLAVTTEAAAYANSELESVIPLEKSTDHEFRNELLRYKSFEIPTTFELPKSGIKRLPDNILTYFDLKTKLSRRKFRAFLRREEKKSKINNNINKSSKTVKLNQIPTNITIISNENSRHVKLSDIPSNDKPNLQKEDTEKDIITISESDTDSVIEVPLPPIPTYNVDTTSESEGEDIDMTFSEIHSVINSIENSSVNPASVDKNTQIEKDTVNENDKVKADTLETQNQLNNSNLSENPSLSEQETNVMNKNNPVDMNQSFTELEKERDDLLGTPDDFLEHDVKLNTNNIRFNFGLHSSELDLNKDKEESNTKLVSEHDLYETESSCSEIGSVHLRSRPVFTEINFENPTKDIFCEPDLNKFSNFITPNRSIQSLQNKIRSNKIFTCVKTKVDDKNKNQSEAESENKRRSHSESSEYHSDATSLKIKKKNKKVKKKIKKKVETQKITENTDKTDEKSQNTLEKNSVESDLDKNKIELNKTATGSSPLNYYTDTYYADDCLLAEELEKQIALSENDKIKTDITPEQKNLATSNEVSNAISKSAANFSFMDAWRKSSEQNCDPKLNQEKNEISPNKKTKINDFEVTLPYVVTVLSSDEECDSTVAVVDKNVADQENSSDLLVVNVKNDAEKHKTAFKQDVVINPFSFTIEMKSFKDFRTENMRKFYDNSWGQENFNVEEVLSAMPDDSSKWKIDITDIMNYSTRKKGPMCLRCKEIGHIQYNCTRFSGPVKCSICGFAGHSDTRCPNGLCTSCGQPTNYLTTSCRNCTYHKNIKCSICSIVGHKVKNCPDLWRRYHLTTESETELITSSAGLKTSNHLWCSNCAKRGHCAETCNSLKCDRSPTTMGIINYAPTYHRTFKLPAESPSVNIPHFKDAKVTMSDLRHLKDNVMQTAQKKYVNILKRLKQECNKCDVNLINRINRLQKCVKTSEFDKKKIQEIYKIRARIAKHNMI